MYVFMCGGWSDAKQTSVNTLLLEFYNSYHNDNRTASAILQMRNVLTGTSDIPK